jgi:hypothetical protein
VVKAAEECDPYVVNSSTDMGYMSYSIWLWLQDFSAGEAQGKVDLESTIIAPGTEGYRTMSYVGPWRVLQQIGEVHYDDSGPYGLTATSTFTSSGEVKLYLYVAAYAQARHTGYGYEVWSHASGENKGELAVVAP